MTYVTLGPDLAPWEVCYWWAPGVVPERGGGDVDWLDYDLEDPKTYTGMTRYLVWLLGIDAPRPDQMIVVPDEYDELCRRLVYCYHEVPGGQLGIWAGLL